MTTRTILALLLSLTCGFVTFGQEPESNAQHAQPLRIDVDLVLITVTVTDSDNEYVTGLKPEHFQVFEDKAEQDIAYFSTEDVPLTVGVIFDRSGSMANKLSEAHAAASTFLRMGSAGDEYFLVEFNNAAQLAQNFTTDISQIENRLALIPATGMTALYDAIYLGMEKVIHGDNSRRALLLITDGQDNTSRYSLDDVKDFAKERDLQIYAIGIQDQLTGPYGAITITNARAPLADLAKTTGGRAFFPRSARELDAICAKIGANLKNQYVLGYRSSNPAKDGKWRNIKVKVNRPDGMPRMSVRAKTGYYASTVAKASK